MTMTGWPEQLLLMFGSAWTGVNDLDPGTTISLTRYSYGANTQIYTEDGTNVADDETNRLKIVASEVLPGELLSFSIFGSSADAWSQVANYTLSTSYDYTFRFMWSYTPQTDVTLTTYNGSWLDDSGDLYLNPNVFVWFDVDLDAIVATPAPVNIELEPIAPQHVGRPPVVAHAAPLDVELAPITPGVMKIASVAPLDLDVELLAPQFVGDPPTVTTPAPVDVKIGIVAPTTMKSVTPAVVEIALEPIRPAIVIPTVSVSPIDIAVEIIAPSHVGSPPVIATPAPVSIAVEAISPAIRTRCRGSLRGCYRIFNAAAYRFFRSNSAVPQEDDTPFASSASLPATPADTFADGTWKVSVAYFNGCLQSGFYPVEDGLTYFTLEISGGTQQDPPPGPTMLDVVHVGGGVVEVRGVFVVPDSETYAWAIAYTTNGSDPAEDSPDVTIVIVGRSSDMIAYQLPAQAAGTTVKVRVQIRRWDDPAWTYSDDSEIYTITIEAGPAAVTSADSMTGRLDR